MSQNSKQNNNPIEEIFEHFTIPYALTSKNIEVSRKVGQIMEKWHNDYYIYNRKIIQTATVSRDKGFCIIARAKAKTEDQKFVDCVEYQIKQLESNGKKTSS